MDSLNACRMSIFQALTMAAVIGASTVAFAEDWKAPADADQKKNSVAVDEKSLAAGKDIWGKKCEMCHGESGKGDGPVGKLLNKSPGDLTSTTVAAQSDGAIFWKITEGRIPMPPFKDLSEEQRWQTVNYVRTFAKPAQDSATSSSK